jgi:hypothetical protein
MCFVFLSGEEEEEEEEGPRLQLQYQIPEFHMLY